MVSINPIKKNVPYKYSWLDKPPVVPDGMALALFSLDSEEHCNVYLQEDIVYPEAVKKWKYVRLAHITLEEFTFQQKVRFPFSNGIDQWVDITYEFTVSVKPNKNAVRSIIRENMTDISEPVLKCLDTFTLDKEYNSLELSLLEADAIQKIKDKFIRFSYLKIKITQVASCVDDISKKQIEDDISDKIRKEEIKALEKELEHKKEEAETRRKEAEIAREKAETERELAEIRYQAELEEQQHEIDKKTKEVAAQQEYQLQQAQNVAAVARAQMDNIKAFGLENLVAIDPTYQGHLESRQAKIDFERENQMKDLELTKQKVLLVKEMVESGIIDEMTAGHMTHQLLIGETPTASSSSGSDIEIENENEVLNEDGKIDV